MFTPDGAVYYQAEYNADGSHIIYQDINRDGMTDFQETLSIDPFGEERLYDRDFDGYPEERVRVEFDESNNSITVIYERDDVGLGDYIVTSEKTSWFGLEKSKIVKKITKKTFDDSIYYGPVEILWDTCETQSDLFVTISSLSELHERGLMIARAAECALNSGRYCLKGINSYWFNKITDWFGRKKTLRVACSISETSVAWATAYDNMVIRILGDMTSFLSNLPEIYFNPVELTGLLGCASTDTSCISQNNDDKLCNIFLHELMHHMDRITPHPDHDEYGIDDIYSCGRYCGGCAQNLLGATGDPHADCLRCAGTFDEKLACGYVEEIKEEACEGSFGVCHSGLGCIYGQCEKCKTIYRNTCDEEILGGEARTVEKEDFLCCAQCPADCDSANDFPCETSYLTENTCHDPLPMCSR